MSRGSFQDGRFNRPAVSLPVVVIPVPAKRPPRARPHQWEHNNSPHRAANENYVLPLLALGRSDATQYASNRLKVWITASGNLKQWQNSFNRAASSRSSSTRLMQRAGEKHAQVPYID